MSDQPENLTILPDMPIKELANEDLLSQALSRIRLTGDSFYSETLNDNRSFTLSEKSSHVCIISKGQLHVKSQSNELVSFDEGDILLLPHDSSIFDFYVKKSPAVIIVCRFHFDASSFEEMVFSLPNLIHLKESEAASWAKGLLYYMIIEAEQKAPGAALMVSRIIDLIVIRILRTWSEHGASGGWLSGLSDVRIARTLKAIHANLGKQLSVASLSDIAGMSRSSFCERFSALVGRSPTRYQNECRLHLAKSMLVDNNVRISEVGFVVGYESESSFSRAYKKFFGKSPRDDMKFN